MYKYNPITNELEEVEQTNYSDNQLKERDHIEEWIRKKPELLEDGLLVIAHEYDKFETDERLDLLALDRDGALVIIELKRDNSGSAVEFQSLKYCSYCSQLTPQDIVEIYQQYLNKNKTNENALENILLHLSLDSESSDKINDVLNNRQRFIIAGKEIDKRILSVCAWLTENGIDCKCYTIVPYKSNDYIFIDVNQIIPPYKISDYFVRAKEKKLDNSKIYQSYDIIQFFESISDKIQGQSQYKVYYSPRKSYCSISSKKGFEYGLIFQKRSQEFLIQVLSKNIKLKSAISKFYEKYSNTLEKEIGLKFEFRPEGDRNQDWSRIVAKIQKEPDKDLQNYATEISVVFLNIVTFVQKYW